MEGYIVQLLFWGVISWSATFLIIRNVFPKRSFDFCNRCVSVIHATLAVTLASISVENWSCPACPLASKSSPLQMQTLAISLAYLIYDLFCCLFDGQNSLANTIHHLVSIVGLTAGLIYQKSGSELIAALWVTEISSPFLHLRELLKELGYRDTGLNLIVDLIFAVVFTFGRMVAGPYLTFLTVKANNPFIVKIMGVGLQMVSAFWFYKIAKMVRYKLVKWTSSKAA